MKFPFKYAIAFILGIMLGAASIYFTYQPQIIKTTEYKVVSEFEYLRQKFKGMTLRVTAWSGPYAENFRWAIVEPFEELTGVNIELVVGWAEFIPMLQAAPPDQPPFDVFNLDDYNFIAARNLNKLLPLNLTKIPNAQYVYNCLKEREEWKSGLAIPFDGGIYTIIVNKEVVPFEITSWADLKRPELKGLIAMDRTWYYGLYVGALMLGDKYLNDTNVDAAFAEIASLKDSIHAWYSSGAEALQLLESKEVGVAIYYTGGSYDAIKRGEPLEIIIPKEGAIAWLGSLSIVRGVSPEIQELAEAFINFALSPISQTRHVTKSGNFVTGEYAKVPRDQYFNPASNDEMSKIVFFDWEWLEQHWTELENRWNTEILG
ncbi:extracellular solute-binding protein [Candidatus Bathyarchaeota archaeon]|nr:extracellular solute-binding protein [Candidatus Bathyarchaeota archaeon]MBS7636545.1 extracellular solute-binding protein [Candidatus Bathyarchaeota archaeon]